LAETGLGVGITEFDAGYDVGELNPEEQEQVFRDVLEVAFESQAVDGFMMWGIWDPGHWRGNALLHDEDWNVKDESAPWFDLVQGEWMTELDCLTMDSNGQWIAPDGVFSGLYDFTVAVNGKSKLFSDYDLGLIGNFILAVPQPMGTVFLLSMASLVIGWRHRRTLVWQRKGVFEGQKPVVRYAVLDGQFLEDLTFPTLQMKWLVNLRPVFLRAVRRTCLGSPEKLEVTLFPLKSSINPVKNVRIIAINASVRYFVKAFSRMFAPLNLDWHEINLPSDYRFIGSSDHLLKSSKHAIK
jgi:hypothetical protein